MKIVYIRAYHGLDLNPEIAKQPLKCTIKIYLGDGGKGKKMDVTSFWFVKHAESDIIRYNLI